MIKSSWQPTRPGQVLTAEGFLQPAELHGSSVCGEPDVVQVRCGGKTPEKKRLALHLRHNQTHDEDVQLNSNIAIGGSKDRGKNGVLETILH